MKPNLDLLVKSLRAGLLSALVVLTVGSPCASVAVQAAPAVQPLLRMPDSGSRDAAPDPGDGSGRHRMLAL